MSLLPLAINVNYERMSVTEPTQDSVKRLPKVDLLGCKVSAGTYQEILTNIIDWAASGRSSSICFANVHMLSEADRSESFRKVVNEADLVSPDGRPLSALMRLQYGIHQDRACGMDLLPDILRLAALRKLNVYLYGSTDDLLQTVCQKAMDNYPGLNIVGAYSPPFRSLSPEEDEAVINRINRSEANLLLVSLGCPKQEQWMHDHRGKINACMLGLGQAFRTFGGIEKRLPEWARNLGLEWVYRLWLEPRRLWRRYLVGNSWFLYRATRQLLKNR